MGLLIDTSVLVALERARGDLHAALAELHAENAYISAITASELLHGVHRADSAVRRGQRERFVETVFVTVSVLPFDLAIAREHARLWADLAAQGLTIGAHDLQIAATALAHGLAVLTANAREFGRVPDLEVRLWS